MAISKLHTFASIHGMRVPILSNKLKQFHCDIISVPLDLCELRFEQVKHQEHSLQQLEFKVKSSKSSYKLSHFHFKVQSQFLKIVIRVNYFIFITFYDSSSKGINRKLHLNRYFRTKPKIVFCFLSQKAQITSLSLTRVVMILGTPRLRICLSCVSVHYRIKYNLEVVFQQSDLV